MINFLVWLAAISPNTVSDVLVTKSFAVEAEYLYSFGFRYGFLKRSWNLNGDETTNVMYHLNIIKPSLQ